MKRFALVALGICLAVAPLAHADQWSKTYTITGKPDLRVETSDANIHVDTWDQKTIEARVTSEHYKIGEHGLKIEEHQSGDSVDLRSPFSARCPHHYFQHARLPGRDRDPYAARRTSEPAYRRWRHPAGEFQRRDGSCRPATAIRKSTRWMAPAGARRRRPHHCCRTIRRARTHYRGRPH